MTMVELRWPEGPVAVPALWLRDNCPCAECRVVSTTEHRLVISQVAADLMPAGVAVAADGTIDVDWGDHRSSYSSAWWNDVTAQARRAYPDPKPWHPGFVPERFDHADVTGGSLAVELEMLEAFGRDGAVVITATPTESGACVPFIRRWAPPIEVPFDLVHDVYVDPAGYNVAHTSEALPPHNDMGSKRHPPSGQILHMLVNDAEGGDSVLVDGFTIAGMLSAEHREILASVEVGFRQFADDAETWGRSPILRTNVAGEVTHLRYSNQLLQAIDPTASYAADWYAAYHTLSALITDEANQIQFRLNAGDLLMVQNHRVLHARRAFRPASGARHLQDTYFDADDVLNEAWRLQHVRH